MDRKDKISLLKGIQAGIISIDTLQPKLFRIEANSIKNGSALYLYINDKEVDNETYSKEVVKNMPGDKVEIIIDGMEFHEWANSQRNEKKNLSHKKEQQ